MLNKAIHSFSKKEKIIFFILFGVIICTTLIFLFRINNTFLVEVPIHEGTVVEGVVGTTPPRINPIAVSPFTSPGAENDLIALVYSGLMRATQDGTLIPDLAEGYTISDDGLTYTFTLKDDLVWHDNEPITSADVKFTIERAQDREVNSRHLASWDGVAVDAPDERTIVFTLSEPYSPFLQNTTLGILPEHLWKTVHPEDFSNNKLNTEPIGSGPYKIKDQKINENNTIEYYELEAFDRFALGEPYIETIRIQFYANEQAMIQAYRNGDVTGIHSITPQLAQELEAEGATIRRGNLPRVFGAFLNQNKAPIFTRNEVRDALNTAVDRTEIINNVLYGYATAITGPLPPGSLGYIEGMQDGRSSDERISDAQYLLEEAGWYMNDDGIYEKETSDGTLELSFSITTTKEAPELSMAADILKRQWEKVGAKVDIKIYETKDNLENFAIRPRDFDILLFGEIIGRDADPYAFWHSSQRLDPGLNIASYANITVDEALEKARTETDTEARIEQYRIFQEELQNDTPAIFLYAPQLIYLTHDSIGGVRLAGIDTPSDRFLDVHTWYVKTERVWRVFAPNEI